MEVHLAYYALQVLIIQTWEAYLFLLVHLAFQVLGLKLGLVLAKLAQKELICQLALLLALHVLSTLIRVLLGLLHVLTAPSNSYTDSIGSTSSSNCNRISTLICKLYSLSSLLLDLFWHV